VQSQRVGDSKTLKAMKRRVRSILECKIKGFCYRFLVKKIGLIVFEGIKFEEN
jgi:hypothetical protein